MSKKSFFKERTVEEIFDLSVKPVSIQRHLVKRILDLDHKKDALELRVQLTPGRFFQNVYTSQEASRKCYKHGDLIALDQPQTQEEAYRTEEIPLAIRARCFGLLQEKKEEEINVIGYSFRPVQGRDRRKRVVPFVWLLEAVRLFGYAENMTRGIEVIPYDDASRVKYEGASIICTVPSRVKKKTRYRIRLEHVSVDGVTERRAVAWSLKSNFDIDPEHSTWNMRYTWEYDRQGSDRFTFYPHDIAAYISVIGHYWKQHNLTPIEMSPLALPSRQEAMIYTKLCNNVMIYDPTLAGKRKLRKLHLDEKCILLGRSIKILGHDESMYWDPGRDGKLKNYEWSFSN